MPGSFISSANAKYALCTGCCYHVGTLSIKVKESMRRLQERKKCHISRKEYMCYHQRYPYTYSQIYKGSVSDRTFSSFLSIK